MMASHYRLFQLSQAFLLISILLVTAVAARAAPPAVIVAEAKLEPLVDRIEALGTLRANESVALTASVTETVTAIHFDDGDRVATGDILVEMTSAEERAQLAETRAQLEEALRQYQRLQALAKQGTASRSLLDERRRESETARARLAAIESRLADRLIKAPFGGVVGLRNLSLGALVKPGDLITTLDDDSVMKLEFSVPSTYLESLQPGLAVVAKARAFGNREFRGTVRSIDSRVDPVTRSILVRALVPNPGRTLKPGMLMQVDLLRNPRDALMVPETALIPLGRVQYVLTVDRASRVERREVQIGTRRPGAVEVVQGIAPGEKVITHGTQQVRDGQQVSILAVDDGTRQLRALLDNRAKQGAGL